MAGRHTMKHSTAEGVARSRAFLAAAVEICVEHAETCPTCAVHFKCDTAQYWADQAVDAEAVALRWVQRALRDELARGVQYTASRPNRSKED
jgi:hypothetical protein